MIWQVGITTAPRRQSTLVRCLESLQAAGWQWPHVFSEPGVPIPETHRDLPWTTRQRVLGAFPNWYLTLTELYLSDPRADAYLIIQDDVLFTAGLRPFLEQQLWPAAEIGVISLYCPSHYAKEAQSGFHVENRGWQTWGALAYVFSNPSIRRFLSHELPLNHRQQGPAEGLKHIDCVVGAWCEATQLPYFVHVPSLAQHIGETSTLWMSSNTGKRQADRFVQSIEDLSVPGDRVTG